eukprot:12605487-Alexandrium_andersonii.AAC.1
MANYAPNRERNLATQVNNARSLVCGQVLVRMRRTNYATIAAWACNKFITHEAPRNRNRNIHTTDLPI